MDLLPRLDPASVCAVPRSFAVGPFLQLVACSRAKSPFSWMRAHPLWLHVQFANLILGNIGLVILAGQSLKVSATLVTVCLQRMSLQQPAYLDDLVLPESSKCLCNDAGPVASLQAEGGFSSSTHTVIRTPQLVHDRYNENQNIKLSEWSAISGFICALFTFCVPHLHHLRIYSGISVVLIFIFSIIALAISIHDRACLCAALMAQVCRTVAFPSSKFLPLYFSFEPVILCTASRGKCQLVCFAGRTTPGRPPVPCESKTSQP